MDTTERTVDLRRLAERSRILDAAGREILRIRMDPSIPRAQRPAACREVERVAACREVERVAVAALGLLDAFEPTDP